MRLRSPVVVTIGSIGAAAAIAAAIAGVSFYRIGSGSMEPAIPQGAIVIDAPLPPQAGRAMTFTADGSVVTHVFVGYDGAGNLITRGLANPANDDWRTPLTPGDVRGRVIAAILLTAPSFWLGWRGILASGLVAAGIVTWLSRPRRFVIR